MNTYPFKAVFPKVDLITSPESFFASIKYQYREYRSSGVYSKNPEDAYYVYQIQSEFGKHTGFICATSVEDLNKKKILPHEGTLAVKEQQMMHLLLKRKALVKPVLLGYYPIDNLMEEVLEKIEKVEPTIKIKFDIAKELHRLWMVQDRDLMKRIHDSFEKLEYAYIGDGHHRSTTVSLLNASKDLGSDAEKYKNLLTAYFPFNQLNIWDYNRVVDISDIMPSSRFMAELSGFLKIKPLKKSRKPGTKHEMTMLADGQWYSLMWKEKHTRKKQEGEVILDSALMDKHIFQNILRIKDVRNDTRIKYYGGTEPMDRLIKQTGKFKCGVGFCIYPVAIRELTTMADNHLTLPPKSTWFLPRLKSGIIAKDL